MSAKREHLIKTALRLFYKDGIHSTGIDKVLKESGVAKMTLYNHFKSKNELIAATLELQDQNFNGIVATQVAMYDKPIDKLLAIFDALDIWFHGETYRGCYFINTVAEMGKTQSSLIDMCQQHKRDLALMITKLLKEGGYKNDVKLAKQLCLLTEGAIVLSQVLGDLDAAKDAKAAAKVLLKH